MRTEGVNSINVDCKETLTGGICLDENKTDQPRWTILWYWHLQSYPVFCQSLEIGNNQDLHTHTKANKQMTHCKISKGTVENTDAIWSYKVIPLLSANISNKNRDASSRLGLLSAKTYLNIPPLQQLKLS